MDTDLEDVWYNWLGSSYQSIRYLKSSKNDKSASKGKQPVSKVEEHINNLTESLSSTQVALERAGESERLVREQHDSCAEALAKQEIENSRLEEEIKRLYLEVEECHLKREDQTAVHERLKERIHELVGKVKKIEREADDNRYNMDNERLIHLQEREALRVVHAAHEDCLASLRAAQETLAAYQEDIALRDGIIQNLKRHKSRISSKLGYFSTSLRRTSKELEGTKKRLAEVSEQLRQAEQIIQQHFSMLSSLESYKARLAEELCHLRSNYEDRTLQLVRMRETLLERNNVISDLRDKLEERDNQLRDTESHAVSTQQELASTIAELVISKNVAASAVKDVHEIRDFHTKVSNEKDREITELDQERTELKTALKIFRQENSTLKSDLATAQADIVTKDDSLAREIAAHTRTSKAAEAQKLRLQNSIENLRMNLEKANDDLKKTRETLFALNEKCHNFARAQMSLASYQKRTKMLLDNSQPVHQRHDSGMYIDTKQLHERQDTTMKHPSIESTHDTSDDDDKPAHNLNAPTESSHDVNVAFMLKVKARQQIVNRLQQSAQLHRAVAEQQTSPTEARGPESIFEPLTPEGSVRKSFPHNLHLNLNKGSLYVDLATIDSATNTPVTGNFSSLLSSSFSPASASSSVSGVPASLIEGGAGSSASISSVTSPTKRVRFAMPADEGYQTDDEPDSSDGMAAAATTSEGQIWGMLGNLDKARRDFKTVKRQQRRKNLKVAESLDANLVGKSPAAELKRKDER